MTADLETALRFYGLGGGHTQTRFVAAEIEKLGEATVTCKVAGKRCEFLRSQITVRNCGADAALVELPASYITIFSLWDAVLDAWQTEKMMRRAEEFNAPYLQPEGRRPERVGSIRI